MFKLKHVKIYNYKCIETEQTFDVESDTTVLVGMNESGKTSILEAMAKVNYFEDDEDFKFNLSHDYPRVKKKSVEKKGEDPIAIELTFVMSDDLKKNIEDDILLKIDQNSITYQKKYSNNEKYDIPLQNFDMNEFLNLKFKELELEDKDYIKNLNQVVNSKMFEDFINEVKSSPNSNEDLDIPDIQEDVKKLLTLSKYFKNNLGLDNPIKDYVLQTFIVGKLPKFMYYDDYYALPSRVSLSKLTTKSNKDSSDKTAMALLELADINTETLLKSNNFEDFKAELEATQADISMELFKYWRTNKNIRINFDIDKKEATDRNNNTRIVERILEIRVQNLRTMVTLPLENRSKGFNWFFSFLVWFKKIQEDKKNTYILLLDEPGLNLHAMAQADLLNFIDDLSKEYQIIYTTHSPFMIESDSLNKVRTVVEKEDGTHISDSVQEKDPNTLFPLQAALGYSIAQNLFISKKNLIVEGIADLVFLNLLSNVLVEKGKTGLNNDITIVPVGGIDKVATFLSLLRSNNLEIVCLLDTIKDQSTNSKLNNLIKETIIKQKRILYFHDFTGESFADFEDMFEDEEYIRMYNGAFCTSISKSQIDDTFPIMKQLKTLNGNKDFNHYAPANYLTKNINDFSFDNSTIDRFEKMFTKINKLFE